MVYCVRAAGTTVGGGTRGVSLGGPEPGSVGEGGMGVSEGGGVKVGETGVHVGAGGGEAVGKSSTGWNGVAVGWANGFGVIVGPTVVGITVATGAAHALKRRQ